MLFSVVLDKICVSCLYPIPDSQQYVKRGSWRRPILSGLLCYFHLGSRANLRRVSNLDLKLCSLFYFIEFLSHFCFSYLFGVYFASNCYLSLKVMLCHFVSCLIFCIYSCQMSFNCVSWFNRVVNYIMCVTYLFVRIIFRI